MPHVTIEYSANLDRVVEIDALVVAVHEAVLATGHVSLDALRTRAIECRHYAIADRYPSNAFVAASIRIGPGRTDEQKHELVAALSRSIEEGLGPAQSDVMISAECQEIDAVFRINTNNVRAGMAARSEADGVER